MTQPAPPPQQATTQQRTAALAALLATVLPLAALVAGFATLTGLPKPVALRLLEQTPARLAANITGPAARAVATAEPTYRAAYLLNAADRIRAAIASGRTAEEALAAEQRFTAAHTAAQANRAAAASAVDHVAARQRSLILGWRAVKDSRTTAECAAADGKNFDVLHPPAIGYPGMVHPHCRCRAVAAFAGAGMVGETTAARQRKAAVA